MMQQHPQIVRILLRRIADFFLLMSDNQEMRLFYVYPVDSSAPYAYQHSSIRDVATVCNLIDLLQLFQEEQLALSSDMRQIFEKVVGNTLKAYTRLYLQKELPNLAQGNIGDLGFFLLAILKCQELIPRQLPENWEAAKHLSIDRLIERQNPDGSLAIFFDKRLEASGKDAEAFYLPEALIGLMAVLGKESEDLERKVEGALQKALKYCCREGVRKENLGKDSSTFYFNWQCQLLFHWIKTRNKEERSDLSPEIAHLKALMEGIRQTRIARIAFVNQTAAVEVACYLEGLSHAKMCFEMLGLYTKELDRRFSLEFERCLAYLYELQSKALDIFHGGIIHGQGSRQARVDVAGHVLNALKFYL